MARRPKRPSSKKRSPKNRGNLSRRLFPANTYYLHTMPGLEKIAWREVKQKLPRATRLGFKTMGHQNGLLILHFEGDPAGLLELRTIEDAFLVLASSKKLPPGRPGLAALTAIMRGQTNWPAALKIHRTATGYQPKPRRQTTFRVISRLLGKHPFHRQEAQSMLEKAIQKTNTRWLLVEDQSVSEIWLNIFADGQVIIGLRLSDQSLRQRAYKVAHLPAALRPSVAAAMVLLSAPDGDDIVLDPMCGTGTILIERALWGPYKQLLGGDISREAVGVALANIGSKYKPIQIQQWDAIELTMIPSHSVDAVICNLPFGKQIGSPAENKQLYQRFLTEMARVLKPQSRLVLLSADFPLLNRLLRESDTFKILETVPFILLGVKATIFVARRLEI